MSKQKKILLGILTISPAFFMIWYFFNMFSFMQNIAGVMQNPDEFTGGPPPEIFGFMGQMFLPMILLMFVSFGLLIYYMVHILSVNEKFKTTTSNDKVLWVVLVLFTGFMGMIAYFFVEIWPTSDHDDNIQSALVE